MRFARHPCLPQAPPPPPLCIWASSTQSPEVPRAAPARKAKPAAFGWYRAATTTSARSGSPRHRHPGGIFTAAFSERHSLAVGQSVGRRFQCQNRTHVTLFSRSSSAPSASLQKIQTGALIAPHSATSLHRPRPRPHVVLPRHLQPARVCCSFPRRPLAFIR
jgi:hypothetical protein